MHLLFRVLAMTVPIVAGLTVATQLVAQAYGYHAGLGEPDAMLDGWRLYAPWRVLPWFWRLYDLHPTVFRVPLVVFGGSLAVSFICLAVVTDTQQRGQAPTTYGSARWATDRDVRRSGLI